MRPDVAARFAIFLALWMVGCIVEGWHVMRRADDVLDVYDTDEPVPLLPVDDGDRCTHPDCEKARELHRQRIRRQLGTSPATSTAATTVRGVAASVTTPARGASSTPSATTPTPTQALPLLPSSSRSNSA